LPASIGINPGSTLRCNLQASGSTLAPYGFQNSGRYWAGLVGWCSLTSQLGQCSAPPAQITLTLAEPPTAAASVGRRFTLMALRTGVICAVVSRQQPPDALHLSGQLLPVSGELRAALYLQTGQRLLRRAAVSGT
jgi:hypothetical protein